MKLTEKTVSRTELFSGHIISLHLDKAELEDGKIVSREVVEHRPGVAVLPIDRDGICYFVRQFRYPLGETVLEIPAGKLEQGEDPEYCARRELSEETGLEAGKLTSCGCYYVSPGFTTEKIYVYIASELVQGASHPDEGEYLNVETMPLVDAARLLNNAEINDAKTAIALQFALASKSI